MAESLPTLPEQRSPVAPPPMSRQLLIEEILVVLSLSLLPSAVDALLTLFEAPVSRSIAVGLYPSVELARQISGIVFSLAPVALVFHLIRRNREDLRDFGLATDTIAGDVPFGLGIALVVSAVGLGLYLSAIALNVNRFVVPVPPLGHWWTVPVLLLGSLQNGLLEDVVVVGYLIHRLEQLGWAAPAALVASALLRGSYHLYQGWGSFLGNLLLGLLFGWIFLRRRRVWPLVTADFAVDSLAGIA